MSLETIAAGTGIASGVNSLFGGGKSSPQGQAQMADPYGSQRQQWQAPLAALMNSQMYNPFLQRMGQYINQQPNIYMNGLENLMNRYGSISPSYQSWAPQQQQLAPFDMGQVFSPGNKNFQQAPQQNLQQNTTGMSPEQEARYQDLLRFGVSPSVAKGLSSFANNKGAE